MYLLFLVINISRWGARGSLMQKWDSPPPFPKAGRCSAGPSKDTASALRSRKVVGAPAPVDLRSSLGDSPADTV